MCSSRLLMVLCPIKTSLLASIYDTQNGKERDQSLPPVDIRHLHALAPYSVASK